MPKWSAKVVQKLSQSGLNMIPKWSKNDAKVLKNDAKVVPKWCQSGPKMMPKWSQNDSEMRKMFLSGMPNKKIFLIWHFPYLACQIRKKSLSGMPDKRKNPSSGMPNIRYLVCQIRIFSVCCESYSKSGGLDSSRLAGLLAGCCGWPHALDAWRGRRIFIFFLIWGVYCVIMFLCHFSRPQVQGHS